MILLKLNYLVDTQNSGRILKSILKNELGLSERLVSKLKFDGKILCNSLPVHINTRVNLGDSIDVLIDFIEESDGIIPEPIDIDIIYEDEYIIALNKQPGIVVHPVCSHPNGTIANGLKYYFDKTQLSIKIRPVSRLDRDTTGIIIFAKNQHIQQLLINQMAEKTFKKEYLGVVHGIIENPNGKIDLPIERKPDSIMLRHVSSEGSPSVTHYSVIEYFKNSSFLKFNLETGRTHQIRVHCQAIGHPLVGDTLYPYLDGQIGPSQMDRQALHSMKAQFLHPIDKKEVELVAPLPSDFQLLLEISRK